MPETTHLKILPHHLEREACLYVRQSSPRQVVQNPESGRRQYGLQQNAMALGWPTERIRVIDEDQGKSGAHSPHRSGFRDLMARIAAGEVGIVLGLEVSRLARDNADWHQLLRLAGITDTLILDETGIYDPNDGNDRLLLGFKGTMSEFELRGILARMIGGRLSAARRGALKTHLPIGLVYHDQEVGLDPDRSITEAMGLVFEVFRRKRSARATVKWLHQENLPLPSRPSSGPLRGEVRWGLPSASQVHRILKNPRYAGAYVYGKTRVKHHVDGTTRIGPVPMDQWRVCIPHAHAGFISWDEYCRNQTILADNAAAFVRSAGRNTTPREGAALLQSRVLCGRCGHRMSPQYTRARPSRKERASVHYVCREKFGPLKKPSCQRIRGDGVDAAVSRFVIDAMNQQNIHLALSVQDQVRAEFAAADAQRAQRVEALRYQADLARRRFYEVDPANRQVAATLEADWNARLMELEEACRQRTGFAETLEVEISGQQAQRIRALTQVFEQVWTAPEIGNADRKRLLGLLIEDATLTREGYEVSINLRLRGGRTLTLDPLPLPKPLAQLRKTRPETLTALDRLLDTHSDAGAAQELNRAGHRTWKGEPYTAKRVLGLRHGYGLRRHLDRERERLRGQGFKSAGELALQLGVNVTTVRKKGKQHRGITREIILTEGREYCMYKLHSDPEPVISRHGPEEVSDSPSTQTLNLP